jgi:hypothetical protein
MKHSKLDRAGYLVFASTTENIPLKKPVKVSASPRTGLQKVLTTSVSTFLSMMACIQVKELVRLVSLKDFLLLLELDVVAIAEESTDLELNVKGSEKDGDMPSM